MVALVGYQSKRYNYAQYFIYSKTEIMWENSSKGRNEKVFNTADEFR